jgi:glyoxylase I family protein
VIAVEGLHHVSICVTDLERARRFYGDALGLSEIERPPFDFPGAWYAVGEVQLHLIVHPHPRTLRGTTDIDSRDGHYALRVTSYQTALRHLLDRGIPCRERAQNLTAWPQLFITDPDGNVIELNSSKLD